MLRDPRLGQIEEYLGQLSRELGDFPVAQRSEIIRELKSHLYEKLDREPYLLAEELFAGLGSPAGCAQVFAQEICPSSSVKHIGNLSRMPLYLMIALASVTAMLKLMFPQRVGVWLAEGSLSIYLLSPNNLKGHDFLGYWLVPLSIGVVGVFYALLRRQGLLVRGRQLY
jgi:hypothetical protein